MMKISDDTRIFAFVLTNRPLSLSVYNDECRTVFLFLFLFNLSWRGDCDRVERMICRMVMVMMVNSLYIHPQRTLYLSNYTGECKNRSWRGECDEADKVFCVGCDDTDDLTVTMMMTLMKMKKRA